jgi:hypothetical protein
MTVFAKVDQGLYIGVQTATPPTIPEGEAYSATNLYGAKLITDGTLSVEGNTIDGVAGFGAGIYFDKSVRTFVIPKFQFNARVTLDGLMAYLVALGSITTTGSVAPFSHRIDPYVFNSNFPFFTIAMLYGQTAIGSALLPVLSRDCKITEFTFKLGAKEAVTMSMGFTGRNSGKGKGTEVYAFDSTSHYPSPGIAANVFSLPTWMGVSGLCVTEAEYKWSAKTVTDIACIGKSETLGVLITEAGWDISLKMVFNDGSVGVFTGVNYGTEYAALLSGDQLNLSSLTGKIPEGAHSFVMNSSEYVTGTTPFSVGFTFPDVQWTMATVQSNDPLMIDVKAKTFGANWYGTVVNSRTHAQMILT